MLLESLGSSTVIEGCQLGEKFDSDTLEETLHAYVGDTRRAFWAGKKMCYGQTSASELQRMLQDGGLGERYVCMYV
jgi:hypothetical protein